MTNDRQLGESSGGRNEDAATETCADSVAHRLPKQIGRFHIKGILASGGMGVVYRAIQDQPRRTVAVKVMRAGIASRSAMRRFEYESQVLARLRHPGIAQVFEAGTHDDGTGVVPYFAMEYVPNAKPITQYANQRDLGTRERLQLFLTVCDAVHHGHQKGIIHRDLKPDNILVDPEGVVKIIDFGVARGTDSDLAVTTLQTDVGQLVGTLQYMSPEQCEADPDAIDARSDVYALGVVLFELVAGQLPYQVSRKHIIDGTQVIREHAPTRLSTINRTLRGDVETIVLKALEKEPSRRYQSATELANDIRAYLAGEAIKARPPSAIYRMGLYARRNKARLTAVVAVTLIALTAAVMVLRSHEKVQRAEDEIAMAMRRATAAEKAAAASRAVGVHTRRKAEDLIGGVPGRFSFTTRDGSLYDFASFSDYKATVINVVAMDCPFCLMQIPKVESIRVAYQPKGVRFVNVIGTLSEEFSLARCTKIHEEHGWKTDIVKDDDKRIREALGASAYPILLVLDSEVKILQVYRGNRQDLAAKLSAQLDSALYGIPTPEEKLSASEKSLRDTIELNRKTLGEDHQDTLAAMERLALNLKKQGKDDEAESAYRQIWNIRDRTMGESDPQTLQAMANLGVVLQDRGKFSEAELIHRRTYDVRRRVLGDDHPDTRLSMAHLGQALSSLGKTEGVRPFIVELIELRKRAALAADEDAIALNQYAWLLLTCEPVDLRDPVAALPVAQAAVKLSMRKEAGILDTLALAQAMTGDLESAIETQREGLARIPAGRLKQRWNFQKTLIGYLEKAGDFSGIEALHREKLAVQRAMKSPGSAEIGFTLGDLGCFLLEQKRYAEAESTLRECVDVLHKSLPEGNSSTVMLQGALGMALAGQGSVEEADRLIMDCLERTRRTNGMETKDLRDFLGRVIAIYTEQGKAEEAAKYSAMLPAEDTTAAPVP